MITTNLEIYLRLLLYGKTKSQCQLQLKHAIQMRRMIYMKYENMTLVLQIFRLPMHFSSVLC